MAQNLCNTDEELDRLLPEVSNWGRWGTDDQLGTLNFITQDKIVHSSTLIKSGKTVSLSRENIIPLEQKNNEREIRKYELRKDQSLAVDYIGVAYHGIELTHLDALCHALTKDWKLFNGNSVEGLQESGAQTLGIEQQAKKGIVSRGILLDVAKYKGRNLEACEPIFPEDLEQTAKMCNVTIATGDILFIRTGRGVLNVFGEFAGIHARCLKWLHQKEVALLGSDGGNECSLKNYTKYNLPIHNIAIPYMGLPLLDNAELDELSKTCEEEKRWKFMVVIAPWRFKGATGSPVNPLAIF